MTSKLFMNAPLIASWRQFVLIFFLAEKDYSLNVHICFISSIYFISTFLFNLISQFILSTFRTSYITIWITSNLTDMG